MKTEFMVALTQLSAEKHLPKEVVLAAVESALVSAYRKDAFDPNQEILAKINSNTGEVKIYVRKTVIETPTDPLCEISLEEAIKIDRNAQIGDIVSIESTPPDAGRIAAQTARQVILQRLHEAEHRVIYEEFTCRGGDVITGMVQRITPEQIHINLGKAEAILPHNEQVRNERYRVGQRLKLYLLDVAKTSRGPQLFVSRSHPNLLYRLFELEIPEIYGGIVELKSIARDAGYRSKVAVAARQDGIDPVGCCVGLRGIRIQNVVNELNGEKMDVVEWSSDPAIFIANALSPAQVLKVKLDEKENTAMVIVPDKQLSLAIGKEGQNARLAARLTGWRIDIKSSSAVGEEKATLIKDVAMEAEETIAEVKEVAPESMAVEELLIPEFFIEAEISEEVEVSEEVAKIEGTEVVTAPTEYELFLTSDTLSPAKPAEPSQIRFAEDILPSKSVKTKGRKSAKKDADVKEAGVKPKKSRRKQADFAEEEDFEDQV